MAQQPLLKPTADSLALGNFQGNSEFIARLSLPEMR